jgi:hypothetical protein
MRAAHYHEHFVVFCPCGGHTKNTIPALGNPVPDRLPAIAEDNTRATTDPTTRKATTGLAIPAAPVTTDDEPN